LLEKNYNEDFYWNIFFLGTDILRNLWCIYNLSIYKMYKKHWKKRIFWKSKKRKHRKKYKMFKIKIKSNKISYLINFFKYTPVSDITTNILSYSTLTLKSVTNNYLKIFYKDNKNYYSLRYLVKKFKRNFFLKKSMFRDIFFNFHKEDTKIYLRNYDKKPYWKLRKSRILHWGFFYKNTLRKRRYKTFLSNFLKKKKQEVFIITQIISIYCDLRLSFKGFLEIPSILKNALIGTNNLIFMLPKFLKKKKWKIKLHRSIKLWKKVKKWSFLRFKRSLYPWLTNKLKFPKFLKQKISKRSLVASPQVYYDPFTRSFFFLSSYTEFYQTQYSVFENRVFLLKLHMFRYRS